MLVNMVMRKVSSCQITITKILQLQAKVNEGNSKLHSRSPLRKIRQLVVQLLASQWDPNKDKTRRILSKVYRNMLVIIIMVKTLEMMMHKGNNNASKLISRKIPLTRMVSIKETRARIKICTIWPVALTMLIAMKNLTSTTAGFLMRSKKPKSSVNSKKRRKRLTCKDQTDSWTLMPKRSMNI